MLDYLNWIQDTILTKWGSMAKLALKGIKKMEDTGWEWSRNMRKSAEKVPENWNETSDPRERERVCKCESD